MNVAVASGVCERVEMAEDVGVRGGMRPTVGVDGPLEVRLAPDAVSVNRERLALGVAPDAVVLTDIEEVRGTVEDMFIEWDADWVVVHVRILPSRTDPVTHEYTPGLVSPHMVEPT